MLLHSSNPPPTLQHSSATPMLLVVQMLIFIYGCEGDRRPYIDNTGYTHTGWLFGRENPITRPESDPILACPIGFRHDKLSDASDPGRVRTQPSQNWVGFGQTIKTARDRSGKYLKRE